MNRLRSIALPLAALSLTLAGSLTPVRADDDHRRGRGDARQEGRAARPRARISLDQAIAMAEQRLNARVVRADSRDSGDSVVYVLRLLNDSGRVWTVKVDAATGAMY